VIKGSNKGDFVMRPVKIAAVMLAIASPLYAAAPQTPVSLSAAVASPGRTPDNVKLDDSRKPVEVLQFLGLKSGMSVIDLFGANKYWAEIMAPAVGPKGHIIVWEASQFYEADSKKAFEEFVAKNPNVSIVSTPFEAPSLPKNSADFVMLNLNYNNI